MPHNFVQVLQCGVLAQMVVDLHNAVLVVNACLVIVADLNAPHIEAVSCWFRKRANSPIQGKNPTHIHVRVHGQHGINNCQAQGFWQQAPFVFVPFIVAHVAMLVRLLFHNLGVANFAFERNALVLN